MDGIPTWRTDEELPGIPLAWMQAGGKVPILLATMSAILKVQIIRQKAVVIEQTTFMVADDAVPNWTMTRWDPATLAAIDAHLATSDCWKQQYYIVPMYRRPADTADDVWDPEANDGIGGFPANFARTPV